MTVRDLIKEHNINRGTDSPPTYYLKITDPQPGDIEYAKLVMEHLLKPDADQYKPRPNMKFVDFSGDNL